MNEQRPEVIRIPNKTGNETRQNSLVLSREVTLNITACIWTFLSTFCVGFGKHN